MFFTKKYYDGACLGVHQGVAGKALSAGTSLPCKFLSAVLGS